MAKVSKNKKPPSRQRYEAEHRTRSVRLNTEENEHLDKLLEGLDLSFSGYVKAHIRKDEAMIEKKAEIMASKQAPPSVEERLRCLEDLVYDILSLRVDTDKYPPYCPRCEGQHMLKCEGRETEASSPDSWVPTRKCPRCGFFLDTYRRIDPKSIKCNDPRSVKHIHKTTVPVKPGAKKPK